MKFYINRKAIAMIELVFAIVIMGIVMMSAPMLIERAQKSSFVALQQESIAAAATQMNIIMAAEWDHFDSNDTEGAPVLITSTTGGNVNGCSSVLPPLVSRPLGVTHTFGRYCTGLSSILTTFNASTTLGPEAGEVNVLYNDIDDFNDGLSYNITVYNDEDYTTMQGDYLDQNITVTSNVYYGDDLPRLSAGGASSGGYDKNITFSNPFTTISAVTTNIKLVTVTLTSNNLASEISDKNIFLSAFVCNIGATRSILYTNRP
jgi:type II secretory pathway pseudopilin PulG